jgi:hypothetical protein
MVLPTAVCSDRSNCLIDPFNVEDNIDLRLVERNQGKGCNFTPSHLPPDSNRAQAAKPKWTRCTLAKLVNTNWSIINFEANNRVSLEARSFIVSRGKSNPEIAIRASKHHRWYFLVGAIVRDSVCVKPSYLNIFVSGVNPFAGKTGFACDNCQEKSKKYIPQNSIPPFERTRKHKPCPSILSRFFLKQVIEVGI